MVISFAHQAWLVMVRNRMMIYFIHTQLQKSQCPWIGPIYRTGWKHEMLQPVVRCQKLVNIKLHL